MKSQWFCGWVNGRVLLLRPLQLDGRFVQNTQCLIWSLFPAGENLVGGTGEGRSHYRYLVSGEVDLKKLGRGV